MALAQDDTPEVVKVEGYFVTITALNESVTLSGAVGERHGPRSASLVLYADTVTAEKIKPGQSARVPVPPPRAGVLRAAVSRVNPPAKKGRGFQVVVRAPDPDEMFQKGDAVKAKVFTLRTPKNPCIPLCSVVRPAQGGSEYVLVIEPFGDRNIIKRRNVKVGATTEEWAMISDGLRPTQMVVLKPDDRLTDGMRVKVAKIYRYQDLM